MNKIKQTIKQISGIDARLVGRTQERLDNLTKPPGSLGRMEEVAKQIVGITGKEDPQLKKKVIFTLAADHGVTQEGVSAYPQEVTAQMVYNFLNDGAAINVLAKHVGAKVVVVDIGVASKLKIPVSKRANFIDEKINFGTKNIAQGPAMTRQEAVKAIETGIDIFEDEFRNGIDIIGTGEMGIGNTTASTAIAAVFTKSAIKDLTGRGAGLDDTALQNKIKVIRQVLKVNMPDPNDPIGVLAKVGGYEMGGLAGIILGAASRKVPVVVDGFISTAAALIAYHIEPKVKGYMISSHVSVEIGHRICLDHIGIRPLFDLNLRLGEGTGAALGINICEASVKILTQMATFKSAGVSQRSK